MALDWRRLASGLAGFVLCASALTACGEPAGSGPFKDVIRGAETAFLNLDDFPPSYRQNGNHDAVLHPMLDRVETSLGRYYSGELLRKRVQEEQEGRRGIFAGGGGGRVGGVSDLNLSDLRVSGDQAWAHARVTVWFKTAQFSYQDPRAFPSATNVLDLDLHFVEVNGRWKIDREADAFAPGGGP